MAVSETQVPSSRNQWYQRGAAHRASATTIHIGIDDALAACYRKIRGSSSVWCISAPEMKCNVSMTSSSPQPPHLARASQPGLVVARRVGVAHVHTASLNTAQA